MQRSNLTFGLPCTLTLLAAAALTACGGGGGGTPPAPVTRLQGTAAIGAPLAGARVTVTDSDPATADPAAVTTGADGSYTVDVSGQRAPLLVRVAGMVDGESHSHLAVVPAVAEGATAIANVTPLTSAVAALVAPGGDTGALSTPATLAAAATATQVGNASQLLVNTLRSDAETAALLGSGFDPLSTPFVANGSGADAVLHRIAVEAGAAGVRLTNQLAPPSESGSAAPVTLTRELVATPASAPVLPSSVPAADVPGAAELAALGAKWQACLALPIAERVTLDAAGLATEVKGACDFTPPDWRSNGNDFLHELGRGALSRNLATGATVGSASIVLALRPEGHTDPKVFKHPYCNDGPCVVARFPLTSASGRPFASDWVLGKVNGQWNFVGNQRPFRSFVESRLNRKINMNRDGAAPGNNVDPYFLTDRHESLLRLIFDLSVGDTSDVRAVRWTGPGLPAAGVVTFRSQRCGTDDRMGITFQNGSTRVLGTGNPNGFQFWTGGSSADFVLGAARLDGTPLATPQPVNTPTSASFQDFTPVALGDIAAAVPSWSRYKLEIFRFSNLSDEPHQVLYLRIGAGSENPSAGPAVAWPTLDSGLAEGHLTPTGAQAGEIASFASTLRWTVPDDSYVTSGYLFGQNFATVVNAQNESANYVLRGRVDYEPLAYGDTSAPGWRLASPVAGTALSPSTQDLGSNPNPRCGSAVVPALSTATSDYREVGLLLRSPDRRVRQAIWFWDN